MMVSQNLSKMIAVLLVGGPIAISGFNLVIAGTRGALEVQLIAGKLATRAGDKCSIISSPDETMLQRYRALIYGKGENDKGPEGPAFVTDGTAIGEALASAQGIIVACYDEAMEDSMFDTLIQNSPELEHIAFLSRIGGALRKTEDSLRKKSESAGVTLSIVRAGILKGGGPGEGGLEDFGLSKHYYDTIFELQKAMTTMAFDRFTLGVKVSPGDPFKTPNLFQKMASAQSFDPSDTDTGRIAAAAALLATVKNEKGIDITLSSKKGKVPPKPEEWVALLDQ